jgi:hypothetical protein
MGSRRPAVVYGTVLAVLLILTAVGAVVTGLAIRHGRFDVNRKNDLEARFAAFASRLNVSQPYRDPYPDERRLALTALNHLVQGPRSDLSAATSALRQLGFEHIENVDAATGRRYALYTDSAQDSRAWGMLLVDLSAPTRLVIEVPHPNFDLRTERMGVQLFRLTPGAILLMAGAHRNAADGKADVAHNDRSMFSALTAGLADRYLPQIQLHGFADESLPDEDAVVSTGTAPHTSAASRVAEALDRAGLATCRAWQQRCGSLEGTLNVQARAAERAGSVFIHLELNWRVRSDEGLRSAAVKAVAAADVADG